MFDWPDIAKVWNIGKHGYIDEYFHKNIDQTEIVQNSWKCLEKLKKNDKINKNTSIKVIL